MIEITKKLGFCSIYVSIKCVLLPFNASDIRTMNEVFTM